MPTNGQKPEPLPEEPPRPQERPRYRQLSRGERISAIVASAIFGSVGFVAMFLTENEGGVAVAIILSGALLILGIQGTQIGKLGGEQVGVELMVREEERREVAERATIVAEESPAEAQRILESYQAADPGARNSPAMAAASGIVYEKRLIETLRTLVGAVGATMSGGTGSYDDEPRIWFGEHPITVEPRRLFQGVIHSDDVMRAHAYASRVGARGALLVTNARPTPGAVRVSRGLSVEVATWDGDEDNDFLLSALRHLASRVRTEDPSEPAP